MRSHTTLLLGLLALGLPTAALADDGKPVPDRSASKIRLMGNMGIASAVGEMGGTFTYAPISALHIELGSGLGFSGWQLSLMPKLVGGDGRNHVSIGVGPSVAVGSNRNPSATCISYWLNAEVGYEYRAPGGFSFLLAIGIGSGLGGTVRGIDTPGITEAGEPVPPEPARDYAFFPQGRIAVGRWF